MTSALSLPPSEPEHQETEERGAPLSRVRPKNADSSASERDALARYYADLAGRRPLTRDGEVAIGEKIEAGERAILRAWIDSPRAFHEIALTADDVRTGVIAVEDLLIEPDNRDAQLVAAQLAQLGRVLDRVREIAASPHVGSANALTEIVTVLAELPLDPALGDRIERTLQEALTVVREEERAGLSATLSAIARARRSIARAKGQLVEANLRLAISIARQFHRIDVPLVDLAQEGNLGLIQAAERFDYRRGHRFSTYATWWIKQAIRRAVLRQGKGLRMPAHLAEARGRITRVRRELANLHGREPSHEEIADRSGLTLERVRVIAELALEPLSFDAPVGEEGDTSFGDLVAGSELAADEALATRRLIEQTRELLDGLAPREREILERRYGLRGREDETLEEIGKSCSLTRERIRQIEAQALEKLRTRSRLRKIGSDASW